MDGVEQTNESWRILIVEDDERLAELTREYLESNGLTVSLETHGGAAVGRIRNEQPDLVVLDLASTPAIAQRSLRATDLWDAVFATIMMGDDRAVTEVWIGGQLV